MSAMPDQAESRIAEQGSGRAARRLGNGVERTLIGSLWLALLPVAFLLLSALASFAYAVVVLFNTVDQVGRHPFPAAHHIGSLLLEFDLFLIGSTALISAIGFYELFIGDIRRDGEDVLPAWLQMHDLNELKSRVVSMIVLVLAVTFVEQIVDSGDGLQTLEVGGAVAVVILGLTAFQRWGNHARGD
jgi:uncharacterized membrane protein YqhA